MTTLDIETEANRDGAATGDLNLKTMLRLKVVPLFLEDVGYVGWRRVRETKPLPAALNYVDIGSGTQRFGHMREIYLTVDPDTQLEFIGDDDRKVLKAKSNTVAARPANYFIEGSGSTFNRVSFDAPADQAYTVALVWDFHIEFPNMIDAVDLDPYIPREFQWALVDGLQREIFSRRFGQSDDRYMRADSEYQRGVAIARENSEKSRGSKPRYAR